MSNTPGMLSRIFGRSKHPVVSSLAAAVLNRPLLAHPALAEAVIGGYLAGTITSFDTQLATERVPMATPRPEEDTVGSIGVINITGGLVNRPMPGPSGGGPISYTAIRDSFDELYADDSVSAIVLRIESPGGMASGCFDLTDHIYANRGKKPIHALVDDYAFSAAYAIAAACDEIWVSRTGATGSVGVVGFHEDRSGANEKAGIKITPIYAGARKIDLNPNFPLTNEARDRAQAHIDSMYQLFTSTVAKYRGVSIDAIQDTDADAYHGEEAISAGLATRMGTWDDLVAHLGAPGVDSPEQPGDESDEEEGAETQASASITPPATVSAEAAPAAMALSQEDQRRLARGRIIEAIQGAALTAPATMVLLEVVQPGDDVDARIAHAREVIDLCKAAGPHMSPEAFIRNNIDLTQVRSTLIEAKAEKDDAISLQTTLPAIGAAKASAVPNSLDPTAIYQKRGN